MNKAYFPALAVLTIFVLAAGCKARPPSGPKPDPTPGPTAIPVPTATPFSAKRVFVNNFKTTGDLHIGQLTLICQRVASISGLGGDGIWVPWLSTASIDAKDRLSDGGPWYLVDESTLVANNLADIIDGKLSSPIITNARGDEINIDNGVWTGTTSTGVFSGNNCAGWTGSGTGEFGSHELSDAGWTSAGTGDCAIERYFYCFEL